MVGIKRDQYMSLDTLYEKLQQLKTRIDRQPPGSQKKADLTRRYNASVSVYKYRVRRAERRRAQREVDEATVRIVESFSKRDAGLGAASRDVNKGWF